MIYSMVYFIYLIGGAMIRIDQDKIKPFWKHLEKNKIFTVKELALLLKCSIPNARLKLKRWKVYTSYNQNGRFYTLPQVPNFDDYGLWHYKKVSFSKNGNLKKTIVHLVSSSPAGFTGKELGVLVGLIPQSFVHHLRNYPGISREKHDGVFVYFSDETPVYKNQVAQRISLNYRSIVVNISDIEAVIILVAIIKHHGISAEDILTLPEIKNSNIKLKAIQGFMEYHGLEKKNPVSIP